ncbi:MAG: hypothetical protein NC300_01550 [Bacteroidales bacterium]|nr:hypothetical protein [Clostridium sp.]MCM1202810.1 hypothetical protein [Bacteroidales bacterium]
MDFLADTFYAGYHAFLFFVPALLFLGYVLSKTEPKLYNHPVTGQEQVKKLFPDFSVPDFYQNLEAKLCNIHFIDDIHKVSAYARCQLSRFTSGYKHVADCDLIKLHFSDGRETAQGYSLTCEATMRLFYYSTGRIHTEYEQIKVRMSGKKMW